MSETISANDREAFWVLDASIDDGTGIHCFIPVELDEGGEIASFVVGFNYISTDPPARCERLLGVIHSEGQEACDRWCAANESEVQRLFPERVGE